MEMVLLIGAQASGKSSFYREWFLDSHMRINLDMLRTRHRESIFLNACLEASQRFVIDNTNPTKQVRKKYLDGAIDHRFTAVGFYFQSSVADCVLRNQGRAGGKQVPRKAIVSTIRKLELPSYEEGFDQLHFVRIVENAFVVEDWKL